MLTVHYRVFVPKLVPELLGPFFSKQEATEAAQLAMKKLKAMGNAIHVVEGVRIEERRSL